LTLIIALRVFFNNGATTLGLTVGGTLVNVLITCCLLYILIRIPAWVARIVFTGGRRSTLVSLAKPAVPHPPPGGARHALGTRHTRQPARRSSSRPGTTARTPAPARPGARPVPPRRPRTRPAGRPAGVAGPVRFLQPIPQQTTHHLAGGHATGPPPPLRF